nr:MAG TPA: hypothetical protein [Caudoviricetes sp.]
MNVAPDAYLLVAVEAAAIHHNQKERAAPSYTSGLGFPKYRRWPLWFLKPALFDCGAPLTGSRRLFKPHGAFYARDTERNRVHCRDRGLVWCYAPIALYFHHCNESNSVRSFPHVSVLAAPRRILCLSFQTVRTFF